MYSNFKSFLVVAAALCFVACLCSCDDGSPKGSIPSVETQRFKTGTGYFFPAGTTALEVYSAVYEDHGDGQFVASGLWQRTQTALLNNEIYQNTLSYNIKGVKLVRQEGSSVNRFYIIFLTEQNDIKLSFTWQHENTNIWENTQLDGNVTLKF